MNFEAIPPGTSLFIDANVFVYDFGPDPLFGPPSRALLERVESGDVTASISSHVFSDVAHRLMSLEACARFGWPYARIAQRLRRSPERITELQRYRQALDEILAMGVRVVSVEGAHVLRAAEVSRLYGLLSGDALIVTMMQFHGISVLASNDSDFDRAAGITRFAPR